MITEDDAIIQRYDQNACAGPTSEFVLLQTYKGPNEMPFIALVTTPATQKLCFYVYLEKEFKYVVLNIFFTGSINSLSDNLQYASLEYAEDGVFVPYCRNSHTKVNAYDDANVEVEVVSNGDDGYEVRKIPLPQHPTRM
ncbi:hypothetical protein T265_09859 [Opisthorchis viverrini]|uniref:Uncharacterized protein n=1 Tax=Opisthorchis viverrini TaxID=6198 RepID=A0A074ZFB7_OPIVI|nr:hypothetical protein T265_09859 [Opisthorchis viverrini]KER21930.1 hypothetical protein T265_09859 [Opisthorchis viverrini]